MGTKGSGRTRRRLRPAGRRLFPLFLRRFRRKHPKSYPTYRASGRQYRIDSQYHRISMEAPAPPSVGQGLLLRFERGEMCKAHRSAHIERLPGVRRHIALAGNVKAVTMPWPKQREKIFPRPRIKKLRLFRASSGENRTLGCARGFFHGEAML